MLNNIASLLFVVDYQAEEEEDTAEHFGRS